MACSKTSGYWFEFRLRYDYLSCSYKGMFYKELGDRCTDPYLLIYTELMIQLINWATHHCSLVPSFLLFSSPFPFPSLLLLFPLSSYLFACIVSFSLILTPSLFIPNSPSHLSNPYNSDIRVSLSLYVCVQAHACICWRRHVCSHFRFTLLILFPQSRKGITRISHSALKSRRNNAKGKNINYPKWAG